RHALCAERRHRRGRVAMQYDQIWHHAGGWYGVIRKTTAKKTAAFIGNKAFIKPSADRHRKSAAHLPVRESRVQDPSGIVQADISVDADLSGVAVDLDAAEIEDKPVGGRAVDLVGLVRGHQPRRGPEQGLSQRRGLALRQTAGRPMPDPGKMRKI